MHVKGRREAALLLLLEESLVERVADELRAARQTEFLHDVLAMRLRRARGDVELLRDLLVRVPEREHPQHLALAFGGRILVCPLARLRRGRAAPRAELRLDVPG